MMRLCPTRSIPSLTLSAVIVALVAGLPMPAPAQEHGAFEAWQQYRDSQSTRPDVVRLYTFEDVEDSDSVVPNLAEEQAPLRYGQQQPEELRVVEGRWPDKRAVRLDRGYFYGVPFPVDDKSFTVEAWLRTHGQGALLGNGFRTGGTLLSVGIGFWDGWRITKSYPELTVALEIGRPRPVNAVSIRTGPLPDEAWHHIAATWDGEEMRLYFNGLLAAQREYDGDYTPPAPDAQFRVGYAGHGWGSTIMDVDEVTVYDRALSAEEVLAQAHFYAPAPEELLADFQQAEDAFRAGDTETAGTAFTRIVETADAHLHYRALAQVRLGETLLRERDPAPAVAHVEAALDTADLPERHRQSALALLLRLAREAGPETLPRRVYERILTIPGLSPAEVINAHVNIARSHQLEGDMEAARAEYARIMQMDDLTERDRLDMQLELGHLLLAAGEYEEAREAYGRLVGMDEAPGQYRTIAQLRIAESFVRQDDLDAAKAAFAQVEDIPGGPAHHGWEARERIAELERVEAGLPARDPTAGRVNLPPRPEPAVELHVAPDGSDDNPGTRERPFGTLERARDAIRLLKRGGPLPAGGVAVNIRGGQYAREQGFVLEEQDSGTQAAPIIYRASPGERPVLSGGVRVEGFAPVEDPEVLARIPGEAHGHVLQVDLAALGITEYGELAPRGFGMPAQPILELFVDGVPMTPARWPNEGFVTVGRMVEGEGERRAERAVFEYDGDRHARWVDAEDPWLFGYWYHHWADGRIPVAEIRPDEKRVVVGHTGAYGIRQGQRYFVFNLLEELDAPGEWYLNRETGILYFYPPAPLDEAVVEISMVEDPLVRMDEVSHVTMRGLVLEMGRGSGVVINGGEGNLLAGCTIRRLGDTGVMIDGGTGHGVLGCDIHTLGRNGTWVRGGDRPTLTPGGHFIENNHIHDFSRIDRTYTPAVWMDGVGNRIAHNLMNDSPHHAMRIEGNDHIIEFNEIHSVVYESDDQSGLDMWFNPTYRGNIMRYNFWHHIGSDLLRHGQAGIRLDDAISGVLMYGNIFWRSSGGNFGGIQIHGGKDNIADNNIFVDCFQAITFSLWGQERWERFLDSERTVREMTEVVDIHSPPYSERYPELAHIRENQGVNHVWRNLVYACGQFLGRDRGIQDVTDNLVTHEEPGFADLRARDLRVAEDSPLYDRIAFRPIPFEQIGLYEDEHRATWPVEHEITPYYTATPPR